MKITSISAHYSTPQHTALKTDQPLDEELFNECRRLAQAPAGFSFAFRDGFILVRPPQVTREVVDVLNSGLADAQAAIEKKNEPNEQRRQEALDPISAATGLPIE